MTAIDPSHRGFATSCFTLEAGIHDRYNGGIGNLGI